jgi:hypothetical protein
MTKKKLWLGMLVMVLAFGMTVVGCSPYVVNVSNGTDFRVTLVVHEEDNGSIVLSDDSGISPNSSKTYEFDWDDYPTSVRLRVRVGIEDVEVTCSFSGSAGSGEKENYVLSGSSKETLKLSAD